MHSPSASFNRTVFPPETVTTINPGRTRHDKSDGISIARLKVMHIPVQTSVFMRWAIFIGLLVVLAVPSTPWAAQVTLAWQPNEPSANSYRVYQRQAGGSYNYDTPVWSSDGGPRGESSCIIDGLADDLTYYFVVRACEGKFESNDSNEVEFKASSMTSNNKPVASVGRYQRSSAHSLVYLDGSRSHDRDGDPLSYHFSQTAGPGVELNCSEAKCSFTAPGVTRTTALTFELTVGDGSNLYDTATTVILVSPASPRQDNGGAPDTDTVRSSPSIGNQSPSQPLLTTPIDGSIVVDMAPWITASPFEDPDGADNHLLTQWEITQTTTKQVVLDLISVNYHLTDLRVPHLVLDPASHYSVRVRFFDDKGLSSEWSAPAMFTTGEDSKDMNKNRIPDDQEVSAHTDMNNDNISDIDQQDVIKSFSTYDGQYLVGISYESDGNALSVQALASVDPEGLEIPPATGDALPIGLLAYKIKVSQPGDSAYATVYLSDPIDPLRTHWMRYDTINGWQDSSGTTVVDAQGYVVERSLEDGGEEDADGVANGVIIDLSGPLNPNSDRASLTSSDDDQATAGGAGGGCFIQLVF